MSSSIFVLLILFLTIVAPLWIIFHYVTIWRSQRGVTSTDEQVLSDVWESAQRLEDRIVTLESIIEEDVPEWKEEK